MPPFSGGRDVLYFQWFILGGVESLACFFLEMKAAHLLFSLLPTQKSACSRLRNDYALHEKQFVLSSLCPSSYVDPCLFLSGFFIWNESPIWSEHPAITSPSFPLPVVGEISQTPRGTLSGRESLWKSHLWQHGIMRFAFYSTETCPLCFETDLWLGSTLRMRDKIYLCLMTWCLTSWNVTWIRSWTWKKRNNK